MDIDDSKTTDHQLRYLRRECRRIDEKYEKQYLKQKIRNESKKNLRDNVWGIKNNILNAKHIYGEKFKYQPYKKPDSNILKADNNSKNNKYKLKI